MSMILQNSYQRYKIGVKQGDYTLFFAITNVRIERHHKLYEIHIFWWKRRPVAYKKLFKMQLLFAWWSIYYIKTFCNFKFCKIYHHRNSLCVSQLHTFKELLKLYKYVFEKSFKQSKPSLTLFAMSFTIYLMPRFYSDPHRLFI